MQRSCMICAWRHARGDQEYIYIYIHIYIIAIYLVSRKCYLSNLESPVSLHNGEANSLNSGVTILIHENLGYPFFFSLRLLFNYCG
jgi:hypothetical protein